MDDNDINFNGFKQELKEQKEETDIVRYIDYKVVELLKKIDDNEHHIRDFTSTLEFQSKDLESQFKTIEPEFKTIAAQFRSMEAEFKSLELRTSAYEEKSKWTIGIYLTLLFIMLSSLSFTIEHFVNVIKA